MNLLFLSPSGDGAGIALRLSEEGHDVVAHIQEDDYTDACRGWLKQVTSWDASLDKDTVLIVDCTGMGDLLDLLRKGGVSVIGGSYLADRLEEDRKYANEVMNEVGIATPKTKFFDSWDDAKTYIAAHEDERLVFKPCGGLSGNLPSYVSHNSDELIEMLDFYKGKIHGTPEIALQHFLEGEDVSTEGWFDGEQFLRPFNHTIETKHCLDGDTGPSGGCTGNIVWGCFDSCPLCAELDKVESFLKENNYAPGPIDLNSLITEDGIYGLEFTPRFGYDATPTLVYELFEPGGFGSLLQRLASQGGAGEDSEIEGLRSGFASGVRVTIPPWPSTAEFKAESGLPIQGLTPHTLEHFCMTGVMKNENGAPVTATVGGILGVATGYGESISESLEAAYKIAAKIKVPDKQMRHDLVEHFESKHRKAARALGVLA